MDFIYILGPLLLVAIQRDYSVYSLYDMSLGDPDNTDAKNRKAISHLL